MELIIKSKMYGDKTVLIDDEDYDKIKDYVWGLDYNKKRNFFYVKTQINKSSKRIHQIILNNQCGIIDHINHNGLDNRKCNLRICTHNQNQMNRKKSKNKSSKYKGVCFLKNINKYKSYIKINQKMINLDIHDLEKDAAISYNKAAIKYFGEFALLNEVE